MSECAGRQSRGKLINNIETAVSESLKGIVLSNPKVIRLDFGNIVTIRDYAETTKVKIISGGGSGHEPAYAGYVGNGMLAAAIQGEIYTAPPASDIHRLFKELTVSTNRGNVLIIQNSSGERLHFGLAVEKAKNEAIRIETVVVDDDCYMSKPWKGKRGLSGVVLLYKIAGAMAEANMEMEEIYPFCLEVQKSLVSISFSLQSSAPLRSSTCICARDITNNVVEFGISLNGEPGVKKELNTATEICKFLLEEITSPNVANPMEFIPEIPIILLVNNLGTVTKLEEFIFVKELLRLLYERQVQVIRIYCGRFVTALDTAGFSVTFLKVFDDKIKEYLDAPCEVPVWGKVSHFQISSRLDRTICPKIKIDKFPVPQVGPKLTDRESNTLMLILQFACDSLYSCEKQLNTIDLETGDGDTGTRIRMGMEAIDIAIKSKSLDLYFPFTMLKMLSTIVEKNIEGALGLIYSVFFEAASNIFREIPDTARVNTKMWLEALKYANAAVKKYTKAEAGSRTIYDPLYVCAMLLEEGLQRGIPVVEAVEIAVTAAEEAAQKTRRPGSKYPDPGAHSVAIWLRAVLEGLKSRWIEE